MMKCPTREASLLGGMETMRRYGPAYFSHIGVKGGNVIRDRVDRARAYEEQTGEKVPSTGPNRFVDLQRFGKELIAKGWWPGDPKPEN